MVSLHPHNLSVACVLRYHQTTPTELHHSVIDLRRLALSQETAVRTTVLFTKDLGVTQLHYVARELNVSILILLKVIPLAQLRLLQANEC